MSLLARFLLGTHKSGSLQKSPLTNKIVSEQIADSQSTNRAHRRQKASC